MKLKYFIPSFIAIVAMFVGCTSDDDATYLNNVQVSQSFIAIEQNGGSPAIEINANDAWSIDAASIPDWLTVTPTSGQAGKNTITFSAASTDATRSADLIIKCGNEEQRLTIMQQAEETDPVILTVAEAVALIKSGQAPSSAVYVKGIVCRIQEISVQYGNATYFLSDDGSYGDGNWLEVYRGYWINNEKFTAGDEFAVGDELTIKGVLIDYNGIPETNQGSCEVISINKSLIGIDQIEMLGYDDEEGIGVTEFPLEGGQAKITVMTKGDGFHITIPDEAKSWLHIADFGADYVTIEADKNEGGDRSVTVKLSTESDGTTYTCEQAFTQKGSILEVTAADFIAAEEDDTQYRITGVISELYASDKQGKSFYIKDYTNPENALLVYRVEGFIEAKAKVGDVVTVVGKRGSYKGTAQLVSGTFEEIKYAVTEVTIAEFLTKEDSKEVYYKVTGTISSLLGSNGKENDYGNLYIKDDEGNELYVYGCYPGWGAQGDDRKFFIKNNGIKVGDKLTMIGYKDTYKGLVELCGGICFSFEKAE